MLKIINGLSSPIGQATRSKPPACMGHLLICQVTKCAVTAEGFSQLCPHGPLSWIVLQRADRLIPTPKPHAKKIIAGCEPFYTIPSSQEWTALLDKGSSHPSGQQAALPAAGQCSKLPAPRGECRAHRWCSPSVHLPSSTWILSPYSQWALWSLFSFTDLFSLWAGPSQQVCA